MKRALVTGGAGFIGSHLCEKLLNNGYRVFCVDTLYCSSEKNIRHLKASENFVFFIADVTSLFELEVNEIYNRLLSKLKSIASACARASARPFPIIFFVEPF